MMNKMKTGKILSGLLAVIILTSCSVKKRVYRDGYYVDWAFHKKTTGSSSHKTSETIPDRHREDVIKLTPELFKGVLAGAATEQEELFATADKVFMPSSTFTVKHLRSAVSEVKTSSVEHREPNTVTVKKKKTEAARPSSGGKSQLAALLFCIFLGCIGVHRFYLGYIGIGILQIITLGGCGIWALIDLILIITGELKPKNGDYTETL